MNYALGEKADLVTLSLEPRPKPAPAPTPLTPNQKTKASISVVLKIISIICAIFTVILLPFFGLITYGIHHTLSSNPHTQAEVLGTEIYLKNIDTAIPENASAHSTVYGFRCTVSYSVASRTYQSQADIGYQKSDERAMAVWRNRIHPGDQIEIAYAPTDPTHIRLAGNFINSYAPALFLLQWIAGLTVIGALAAVIARRLRLQSPPDNLTSSIGFSS